MKELQDKFYAAKKEFYEAIINSNKSKKEKLDLIYNHKLLEISSWWEDPLYDTYYKKYIDILSKTNPKKQEGSWIIDDYTAMRSADRKETIIPHHVVEDCEDDESITIYSNRSNGIEFIITKTEYIDAVYDWVIKEGFIGFVLDW